MSLRNIWARAEKPVLYTTLAALLLLGIKNCSDGDVARETNEGVRKVVANTDLLRSDTDTIKAFSRATNTVVTRTEAKVDDLQETADSILSIVDSCCDCNKQPKPAPKKKKPVAVKPEPPKPHKPDTVVVVRRDTVYVDNPRPDTPKTQSAVLDCYLPVRTR